MRLTISLCATISTCTLVVFGYVLVAADITETICIYQKRLMRMARVPPLAVLAFNDCDSVTTAFLLCLFSSVNTAIQFLNDVCLLPADTQCPSSHADVLWCSRPGSIRHSSLIAGSRLTVMNIILLWYRAQDSRSYSPSRTAR